MDNPALTQRLKALLICGLGLLFAVFIGSQIGAEKYSELLLGTVVIVITSVSLFSGRLFWVLTVASSFLTGTFPILGGQFTPFHILMAIGVAKFFIGDVVLGRTKLKFGTRIDALLIAGFVAILTWHGIHDRFGMRFMGSSVWGGKNYVNVYVGLAAFFVIQSLPIKPGIWAKLPYMVLAAAGFDAMIAAITTIYPESIYKIYPFYSAVSTAGIEEVLTANPEITARNGSFGNIGFILILLVLASISLREILNPANLFRLLGLIGGSLAVLYSGFRSSVLITLTASLLAAIRDLKWAILVILPFLAAFLFALSIINSEFVTLPRQIQRSLVFIPGKWDSDMAGNAAASNDFRRKIWTVFVREYFPNHPWLGRGFGFRRQFAQTSVYHYNPNWDRETVEIGNIHNGFLSALDAFGIIGTIFFVTWNVRLLGRTLRVKIAPGDPQALALRFLALYLAVQIISYWYGASSVGSFLPQQFAVAAVFLRLQQTMDSELIRRPAPERMATQPVEAGLVGA